MQELGSQRPKAPNRPRLAGAWLDCSALTYYSGVALGIVSASTLLYLLLGVAK